MVSKSSSKARKWKMAKTRPKHAAKRVLRKYTGQKHRRFMKRRADPKTSNPEIKVKKAVYSRAARQAVLASAAARQQLIEMGGENTIDVIREFDRDMSDEELARKTGVKASDVRVVLNRLHSCGLFTYTRVRDRDSGWYSYIWKMNEGRLRGFGSEQVEEIGSGEAEAVEGEDYARKNYVAQDAGQPPIMLLRRSGQRP